MNLQKFKKLLSYYKPYKKELFLDLFCSVMHSLCVTLIPVFVKYLFTNLSYFAKEQTNLILIRITLFVFCFFVVIFLCQRYMQYQGNMFTTKVETDIKLDLFKHFQKQDFSFYDEKKVGNLMSYIVTDAHNLTKLIKQTPEILLDFSIRFIGAGLILFMSNPLFGFITLGIVSLILCISIYFIPKIQKEIENAKKTYSELISELEENLSGIRTIKSFANEKNQILKFEDNIKIYINANDKKYKIMGTLIAFTFPILIEFIPIVTIISMFFILNNKLLISDLVVFMLYADILIAPIFGVLSLVSDFNEGIVGIKRVFNVMDVQPEITNSPKALSLKKINGNIKFKNVSFNYKSSNKKVIKNLSFEFKAGEYVAIVGFSGVGKSTLCNLIPRFYDVTDGEILIDDIPIKNIKIESLRKNIGFVQQDVFLFSSSIIDNIRYGKANASEEEIITAAKNAYAHEFILALEKGYNTYVGEKGIKLSAGQKQRIAIARAFLKNPSILICDEATSNLDNESERIIQKSMEQLTKNRTTIVIAHRLSTIKNAKRILFLNEAGIIEDGTHEELLSRNGIYANLYKLNK